MGSPETPRIPRARSRDGNGELDGTAEEIGAILPLLAGVVDPANWCHVARRVCSAQPCRPDHMLGDGF